MINTYGVRGTNLSNFAGYLSNIYWCPTILNLYNETWRANFRLTFTYHVWTNRWGWHSLSSCLPNPSNVILELCRYVGLWSQGMFGIYRDNNGERYAEFNQGLTRQKTEFQPMLMFVEMLYLISCSDGMWVFDAHAFCYFAHLNKCWIWLLLCSLAFSNH